MSPTNPVDDRLAEPGGLADRLRELRAGAGLRGTDLAERLGWQQSKVSRIENGRQMPSNEDVRAWARGCGAEDRISADLLSLLRGIVAERAEWRRRTRQGQASVQADYRRLVEESKAIRSFDGFVISGMLQTPEYARAMLEQGLHLGHTSIDDIDRALVERLERQRHLYDPAKRFEFLETEAALRFLYSSPEVMRGQLDRLQSVIGMPNVRFGIVPFGVPLGIVLQNPFVLYDDLALAETYVGEPAASQEESKQYANSLDLLWQSAVTGDAARRLIASAAQALPPSTPSTA